MYLFYAFEGIVEFASEIKVIFHSFGTHTHIIFPMRTLKLGLFFCRNHADNALNMLKAYNKRKICFTRLSEKWKYFSLVNSEIVWISPS